MLSDQSSSSFVLFVRWAHCHSRHSPPSASLTPKHASPQTTNPSVSPSPILSLLPNTYSAHQKALTTTARLLHASPPQYDLAIEILFAVAKELLKAGEAGSGSELGVRMITIMGEAGIEVNESSRGTPILSHCVMGMIFTMSIFR